MEIQGKWTRDPEGYMEFDSAALQRLYETITDKYHQVYNGYLQQYDDEEEAHDKALTEGYEMVTDYKTINGAEEFVTTYITPTQVLDIWYAFDYISNKRIYNRGFARIKDK
jgi:hypothetical protein